MPIIKVCDRCGHREVKAPKLGEFYHEVAYVRIAMMTEVGEQRPYWLLCETCERLLYHEINSQLLPNREAKP